MLVVSGALIPELESVSLPTIKTIVGLATPESGLVQVDFLTTPIRVDRQHKMGIMETNKLRPCVTCLSTETMDKQKNSLPERTG